MNFNVDQLATKMEKLFQDVVIAEKRVFLKQLKECFLVKKEMIKNFRVTMNRFEAGKITDTFLRELSYIETELIELHENIDDKILIFIIGNGNVGKSTLLNALVGDEVAKTNSLPTTWKIDVYSPEVQKDQAIIKYLDGSRRTVAFTEAKKIVLSEEEKTKRTKELCNQEFKKVARMYKLKQERDEIKKMLADKYQYTSNITEVIWPVEKNWLLEHCHLVDTPGLNQNLEHLYQQGGIQDYYHKADGVLWLLDGATIAAANSQNMYQRLQDELKSVGGVRGNIIGVINRMDIVKKNGGEQAVKQVIQDANKMFDGKFHNIIDISAYEGFVGIKTKCQTQIESSGILKLQDQIREIFLSKSEILKNQAKTQGLNKLINCATNLIDSYSDEIISYEKIYNEKLEKVNELSQKLYQEFESDIKSFFDHYLGEVNSRIEIYTDSLLDGKGKEFIQSQIYQLDDFIHDRDDFINNKLLELKRSSMIWKKISMISQYKYINEYTVTNLNEFNLDQNLNFSLLEHLGYMSTIAGNDFLTDICNLAIKGFFFLRKNSIKQKIRSSIEVHCNQMQESIIEQLNSKINKEKENCITILNRSFSSVLFNYEDIELVQTYLLDFKNSLVEDMDEIKLYQLLI